MSGTGQVQIATARAALQTMRNQLQQVNQATCQINLVKSNTAPNLKNTRRLDTTVALANEFKNSLASTLTSKAADALNTPDGVAEFNFQAFADGRLAALPISAFPKVQEWFAKFPPADTIPAVTQNNDHVSKLRFVESILTWAPNGESIRVFRKSSEARIAQKEGIIANWTGQGFDYVDASRSLIFDMEVDFFVWDQIIFVPSYKNLESILNFREITHSVASDVCAMVFALLPVNDPNALRTAVLTGARHLNKLAGLKNSAHIPTLDMNMIQAVITKANLPLTIAPINGVATLEVDSTNPDHVKAYLHILGDDYVESMMTALHYIGIEKEQI